jgi:hypothetical protein
MRYLLIVGTFLLAACGTESEPKKSPNPTLEEAWKKTAPPSCERLKTCAPEVFAMSFHSIEECAEAIKPLDPEAESACTSEEIGACGNDLQSQPCGTGEVASCEKCDL